MMIQTVLLTGFALMVAGETALHSLERPKSDDIQPTSASGYADYFGLGSQQVGFNPSDWFIGSAWSPYSGKGSGKKRREWNKANKAMAEAAWNANKDFTDMARQNTEAYTAGMKSVADANIAAMDAYTESYKAGLETATQTQMEMQKQTEVVAAQSTEQMHEMAAQSAKTFDTNSKLYTAQMMLMGAMSSLALAFSTMLTSLMTFLSVSLATLLAPLFNLFGVGVWTSNAMEMNSAMSSMAAATAATTGVTVTVAKQGAAGVPATVPASTAPAMPAMPTVELPAAQKVPMPEDTPVEQASALELPGMNAYSASAWTENPLGKAPLAIDAEQKPKPEGFLQARQSAETIRRHGSNA